MPFPFKEAQRTFEGGLIKNINGVLVRQFSQFYKNHDAE